jgi:glucosamine--fructose-6-phosphate aminotransferase (isomerizing)
VRRLPDDHDGALRRSWLPAGPILAAAESLYIVGRGPGYGAAQEAALKLKETCGLHAEAISAAEIEHGPMAAVDRSSPVLIFSQGDESAAGLAELAAKLRNRGLMALMAAPEPAADLPVIRTAHAAVTAASIIQSFYMAAADLSLARGLDPDAPPHLQKITETL